MRVLLITPNLYGPAYHEGVNHIVERLVQYLSAQNDEVMILAPSLGPVTYEVGEYGEKIFFVPVVGNGRLRRRLRFWASTVKKVHHIIRTYAIDAALVYASASLLLGPRTLMLKTVLGSRMVLSINGLNRPTIGANWFVGSTRTMVGSPFLLRWFPQATVAPPLTPVHLKPNGTAKASLNGREAFSLLFLGALQKERGIDYLLRGLAEARHRTERPLRLTLALNYEPSIINPHLRQLITDLGLNDIVSVLGIVDINEAYQNADVVIIPRQKPVKMSFPVRILEALSFNKPLIVTTMCDMDQLIEGCGLAVNPKDPEDLARAIVRLAEDLELYQHLASNCATALKKYDPSQTLRTIYTTLRDVAETGTT
jgi:glycosyltransferase involved in cell wall biosynthesis